MTDIVMIVRGSNQDDETILKNVRGTDQDDETILKNVRGSDQDDETILKNVRGSDQDDETILKNVRGSDQDDETILKNVRGTNYDEQINNYLNYSIGRIESITERQMLYKRQALLNNSRTIHGPCNDTDEIVNEINKLIYLIKDKKAQLSREGMMNGSLY